MSQPDQQPGTPGRSQLNLLRELSDQAVLEAIFRDGPITRPEIAEHTGLSKPTVSEAVRRLMQARLVRPMGVRAGKPGRSPVSYAVDDAAGFVVGVDIGGSNIRVGAVDIYGEKLAELEQRTDTNSTRAVARQVYDMVRDAVRTAGATHGQLLALGVSTPGVVDPVTRRVTSLAYNISPDGAYDPLALIRDRYEVPLLVDNNINLSAIGEKWRGLATGVSDFVFISIGAGVGWASCCPTSWCAARAWGRRRDLLSALHRRSFRSPAPHAWRVRGRGRSGRRDGGGAGAGGLDRRAAAYGRRVVLPHRNRAGRPGDRAVRGAQGGHRDCVGVRDA
ncbi:ROK family transcriptional regulator [Fodinicola feengrottensis]|uniref:ROK family transcriptional regulator n=1 Tax=Fodinicola feengrottensis TaxID=435914 RepID=UPI0013D52547|nr:ROK family transcriptional regulator [Fodinicola feengrottensis]